MLAASYNKTTLSDNVANRFEGNLDLFVNRENKGTGIFHAPLDVGDHKVCCKRKMVSCDVDCRSDGEAMADPVDRKCPVDVYDGGPPKRDSASHLGGDKDHLRVTHTRQDVVMHLTIT